MGVENIDEKLEELRQAKIQETKNNLDLDFSTVVVNTDKYLEEIIEHVDNLGDSINVGNDIVNALLNKYYAEAKNKAIIMNVSGHFPNICNISAYHLCTIFSKSNFFVKGSCHES